ncbi:DASS family sodium-coupled anion symporter [Bacillus aquiflavi]|uniref:Sodium-dependent dicarboxylate transporter SdcS n=1 Tax=Bacillus aquiflavi TaxID=2672567 RepID=A0A6B3W588_9BACI|nr:DASS family sodium-coupled anion symporter [Bacillus aquiflavi]MBA4538726.1 DASS family sodium-coupled anion symporter [Bacillus aquiflavi]NEY83086.1 DASS family sodium-coupled anion symporter [Bacillus aquiflavi]UAC49029.1 DASS family sodium-coupled anion symporter [Bacillus aquiflavi]
MGENVQSLWGKLWDIHYKTKDLLLFFATDKQLDHKNQQANVDGQSKRRGKKPNRTMGQNIGFWLGPILFLIILFGLSPEGMSKEALAVLASTVWIATWWITEAIPIPVTSLLPIILFPLTGAATEGITNAYGDSTIFLFLGGFVIAIAMEKWNLHRRIALNIILVVGTSTQRLILGFMVATGFLSMWISNTATAMMMMPIAMAVILHVNEALKEKNPTDSPFGKAIMLGVAYSASIGGLGTLIGTPPNTIFAGVVRELYGIDISFALWMLFGVPLSVVLLIITWIYLVKLAFPIKIKEIPGGKAVIQKEKSALGKMSFEEKLVLTVFSLTAIIWISRTFIMDALKNNGLIDSVGGLANINDTIIAIIAAIVLFILPSRQAKEGKLLNWNDAKSIPWGILLLFGGGLAIAKGFKDSGLATWIGEQLTVLQSIHFVFLIVIVTTLVLFLTEITSNTATATMMFPIMASLAFALDIHPYSLMVAAGIAASCAFMLPVATPPNAIVFGSGYIRIKDMVKAGFWINIMAIFIITLAIYFLMPMVWGIDLGTFPDALK